MLARGDLGVSLQIPLNLALNAIAAVRGRRDRQIRFEIAPRLRRRRRGEDEGPSEGLVRVDAVVCRVSDSGPGVEAVELEPAPSVLGGAWFRFVLPALADAEPSQGVRTSR